MMTSAGESTWSATGNRRSGAGPTDGGKGDCSSALVHRTVKVAVLTEECGEVARAVLEDDDMGLVEELIQVAAVAIAWIEGEMAR